MREPPNRIGNVFALALVAALGVLTLLGSAPGTDEEVARPTGSVLYVSANASGRVLSYNDANTVFGGTVPERSLGGLSAPRGIAVDMARNQLYVANAGANNILVFDAARAASGNVAAARTISVSGATPLSGPTGLALDAAGDRLYVTSSDNNAVMVIDGASTANRAVSARVLAGAATGLAAPGGIAVDATRGKLYVANATSNAILVYDGAATLAGDSAPSRTIAGSNTTLSAPAGLYADPLADCLYVANRGGNAVLAFQAASVATGDVAPSRSIGASAVLQPSAVFVDLGSGALYVTSAGGNTVLVFNNAAAAAGTTPPDRTLRMPAESGAHSAFVDVTPIVLASSAALDGQAGSDASAVSAGGAPRTGYAAAGITYRQFYSFDFAWLPAGSRVAGATLRLYQAAVTPASPYGSAALGDVVVDHVNYGASLDGTAYTLPAASANIGTLSSDSTLAYKTLGVGPRVQVDLTAGRTRSQYRLRFALRDTSPASVDSYAQFSDAEDSCCGVNRPPQLALTLEP